METGGSNGAKTWSTRGIRRQRSPRVPRRDDFTPKAGLLAYRRLDSALGLTRLIGKGRNANVFDNGDGTVLKVYRPAKGSDPRGAGINETNTIADGMSANFGDS